MTKIDFARIEKKWQDRWEKEKIFEVDEKSKKKKFYVLEMYPYPSASGLHIGHAFNYTIGDVYARFKRMQGFNVLYPMGYDSFGLPAENAAIKNKSHPKKFTEDAIKNYIKQQRNLGLSYDWSRKVECHKPDFYKWDQWIFLQMFKKGLAYRKAAPVNWCRKCNTVLANEQVKDGRCYLHEDTEVEIKHLEQWFLKITKYADELYESIEKLKDWPEDIKAMQRNWIGKSHGYEIGFEIPSKKKVILVDAINAFVIKEKGIFNEMHRLLEEFPNRKIILTNANEEETKKFGLDHMPYEVFSLKHKPDKINPEYFKKMLKHFNLNADEAIYFEHNEEAVKSARSVGINSFHYDMNKKDLASLRYFIEKGINEKWPIFTTRPDTLYGATFMVVSAQHPRLIELVTKEQKKEVEAFLKKIKSTSQKDIEELEKEGAFTGSYVVNPATGKKVPVYAGNFVVADYGCGMVMAVPAHDQRDFEFAKKYGIPVRVVIKPFEYDLNPEKMSRAFTGEGELVNSGEFNFLNNREAIDEIGKKFGKKVVNFKLRDWLVSRQRFWGTPIPIVYCDKCGAVPVPKKDLPVVLPDDVKFTSERNPLIGNEKFVKTKCPSCGGNARRETDTMDTFVNSSWYFLRYCDPKNEKEIFDKQKVKHWMPIDLYIGGREHATGHLIFCRFYTKFLRDLGLLDFDEPSAKLFNNGMMQGEDGQKMSKSKGNVVTPEAVCDKFGVDAVRMFLVSTGGPDKARDWSDKGAEGSLRLIEKIMNYFENVKIGKSSAKVEHKINKAIRDVTLDIETMKYNMAIIKLRELFDSLENEISKKDLESFVKLLAPFCPHVAEELWEKIGGKGFVSLASWPSWDEKKINEEFDREEQIVEKTVGDILNILKIVKGEKIYLYVLPNELKNYSASEISRRVGKKVFVFAVNDKTKYDPQGKASRAKLGKPAIYVE